MTGLAASLAALPSHKRRELLASIDPDQRQQLLDMLRFELGERLDPLRELRWDQWLRTIRPRAFDPAYGAAPFAPHQTEAWEWLWSITADPIEPIAVFWPRGHAKSTFAETAVVRLGAANLRRYCLYVSGTQQQADDHVSEIAAILGGDAIATHYPALGDREVGKYGNQKSWNRQRLWTAGGLIVDSLGLDVAGSRGAKLDDERPDMIVFDDIDSEHDSQHVVNKKLGSISKKIMPAAADNAAIILAQNLIHMGSVANRIHTHDTDILADAKRIGPLPAIEHLDARLENRLWTIKGGTPTWVGYGLDRAQRALRRMGLDAFTAEVQQDLDERPGALLTKADFVYIDIDDLPSLDSVAITIDPNRTGRADDAGVLAVAAADVDGVTCMFVLEDLSRTAKPSEWRDIAVAAGHRWGAGQFIVELAGLGEHGEITLKTAKDWGHWPIIDPETTMSKKDRARPVAQLYRDGRIFHVGSMPYLERQWTTWAPDTDKLSPGAVDAVVHAAHTLILARKEPRFRFV